MDFSALFDRLGTEEPLAELPPTQTEAIITLLAAVMYADHRVTVLERAEFTDLVGRLPFYADKARMTVELENAIAAAGERRDEHTLRAIVDAVATHVVDRAVREATYRMALAMSLADLEIQEEEARLLGWLAAAFNLDDAFVARARAELG